MLKKIIAILLIVLFAGATTACDDDTGHDENVEIFNWALAGYKKAPAILAEEVKDYRDWEPHSYTSQDYLDTMACLVLARLQPFSPF